MSRQATQQDLAQAVVNARWQYQHLRSKLLDSLTTEQREVYRFVLLNSGGDAETVADGMYYADVSRAAGVLRGLYELGLLCIHGNTYSVES